MPTPIDSRAAQAILRRYDILPSEEAAVKPSATTYKANVGGHRGDDGQKILTVTVGNVSESRLCPFRDGESHDIVRRLCARHVLPKRPELESMLAQLVERASTMFAKEHLDGFVLEQVRLDNGHYTIGAVHMVRARK